MIFRAAAASAAAEIGSVIAAAADSAASATFLQYGAVLLGGGAAAAWLSGWHRRRSGEDRSTAAEDVAHGATEMAGAVKDLLQPLREENARLHGTIAALQGRLVEKTDSHADTAVLLAKTEAAFEKRRHRDAQELAVLAAEIETLRLQLLERDERIRTLEVIADQAPDRRDGSERRTES